MEREKWSVSRPLVINQSQSENLDKFYDDQKVTVMDKLQSVIDNYKEEEDSDYSPDMDEVNLLTEEENEEEKEEKEVEFVSKKLDKYYKELPDDNYEFSEVSEEDYFDGHEIEEYNHSKKRRPLKQIIFICCILVILSMLVFFFSFTFFQGELLSKSDPYPLPVEYSAMIHKLSILEEELRQERQKMEELQSIINKYTLQTVHLETKFTTNTLNFPESHSEGQMSIETKVSGKQLTKAYQEATIGKDLSTHTTSSVDKTPHSKGPVSRGIVRSRLYNVAKQAKVIRQLTSRPLKRIRKRGLIVDRFLHGYPDLFRRLIRKINSNTTIGWWDTITGSNGSSIMGLGDINLISSQNTPKNLLVENPALIWQNRIENLPIYFTLGFNNGIKVREVGILHSKYPPSSYLNISAKEKNLFKKRWKDSSIKLVSLFIQPQNLDLVGDMKNNLQKFVNQDINRHTFGNKYSFDEWVRIGELEYSIDDQSPSYQAFPFNADLVIELNNWLISKMMFVVHSNWGDKELVILDTVRVYEIEEFGDVNVMDLPLL
ncbi:hypothetical protein DAMA08_042450 [Martiniozyma asiatica (nom. inval.)]|nr:hypothetical protein DAMA08_042450 [Martiniozyma asiatica]